MNNYESVFVLTPVLSEAQMRGTARKYKEFLQTAGAEIVNEENWGLRQLAYPIEKKTSGFYRLLEFRAEPSIVATLEVNFRRDERVIRFLTVRQDKFAAAYAEKRRKLKSSEKPEKRKEKEL